MLYLVTSAHEQPDLLNAVSTAFIDWRAVVRLILRRQEHFPCSQRPSATSPPGGGPFSFFAANFALD